MPPRTTNGNLSAQMPPRTDKKEHHLCFAYRGERMREELFEELRFANVQGTTEADGMQLVRISLQKSNGRRAHTIHKIIEQYNKNAAADIRPIAIAQRPAVCCFKLSHPITLNPILVRIDAAKKSPSYWSWSCNGVDAGAAKKRVALVSLIEKTLGEMKVDSSTLPLERIYDEIQAKMDEEEEEGNTIDITQELRKYIGREQLYLVAPPVAAAPRRNLFGMDDLVFKETDELPEDSDAPSEPIKAYFRRMIPEWGEVASVTAEQVTSALNWKSAGLYKRSCVAPFMRPFLKDGSVETDDYVHYTVHTRRVAEKIK